MTSSTPRIARRDGNEDRDKVIIASKNAPLRYNTSERDPEKETRNKRETEGEMQKGDQPRTESNLPDYVRGRP